MPKEINAVYDALYATIQSYIEKEYPDNGKSLLFFDSNKSLSALCRCVSKSNTYDPNDENENEESVLSIVTLSEFKKQFCHLDPIQFGLQGKTADDITNYDLMEIGLFGKVNTADKTPAQIYRRNQNLIHIYSLDNQDPASVATYSLPDMIANHEKILDGESRAMTQEDLYNAKLAVSMMREITEEVVQVFDVMSYQTKIKQTNVLHVKHALLSADVELNEDLLKKIKSAIQIKAGFAIFGADSQQVRRLKMHYARLLDDMIGSNDNRKIVAIIEKIVSDLSDKKIRKSVIKTFKNTGIVDSMGNILVTHSQTQLSKQVSEQKNSFNAAQV